ncbi:nucleolar protein 12 isoform X3 [Carettochelys insculpta]|uniref:nucleolar protein 12 isoform X3 n=1 Tax=Carettochelys insculpta TaxID=44489 RepID=UPI003EB81C07
MGRKKRGSSGAGLRRAVIFDEESRREYLTGFHKRKVERRKVALEEIKRKLKEEQRKLKEERHKEYLKMLTEREEALGRGHWIRSRGDIKQIHTRIAQEVWRSLPLREDFFTHSLIACTQPEETQRKAAEAWPKPAQETPETYSWANQQVPAPKIDWQSRTQSRLIDRLKWILSASPGSAFGRRLCPV